MTKDPVAIQLRRSANVWFDRAASAEEEGDLASAKWRLSEAERLENAADELDRLERLERRAMQAANRTWHEWCQCLR